MPCCLDVLSLHSFLYEKSVRVPLDICAGRHSNIWRPMHQSENNILFFCNILRRVKGKPFFYLDRMFLTSSISLYLFCHKVFEKNTFSLHRDPENEQYRTHFLPNRFVLFFFQGCAVVLLTDASLLTDLIQQPESDPQRLTRKTQINKLKVRALRVYIALYKTIVCSHQIPSSTMYKVRLMHPS